MSDSISELGRGALADLSESALSYKAKIREFSLLKKLIQKRGNHSCGVPRSKH